jgi:hypothetical protein
MAYEANVNLILEVSEGQEPGDSQPGRWAQAVTLTVDQHGFHYAQGLGRGGLEPATVDVSEAREALLRYFDRDQLSAVLDHVVTLRRAM